MDKRQDLPSTATMKIAKTASGADGLTTLTYEQEVHALLYAAAGSTESLIQYFVVQADSEKGEAKALTQKCIDWKHDDLRRIRALIPQAEARCAAKAEAVPPTPSLSPHSSQIHTDLKVRCHDCGGYQIWRYLEAEDTIEVFHDCTNGKAARNKAEVVPPSEEAPQPKRVTCDESLLLGLRNFMLMRFDCDRLLQHQIHYLREIERELARAKSEEAAPTHNIQLGDKTDAYDARKEK